MNCLPFKKFLKRYGYLESIESTKYIKGIFMQSVDVIIPFPKKIYIKLSSSIHRISLPKAKKIKKFDCHSENKIISSNKFTYQYYNYLYKIKTKQINITLTIFQNPSKMHSSQKLIHTLQNITKRFSSLIFSKLLLSTQQPTPQISYIRHYDIQCQAIDTLMDTLNIQIKKIKYFVFFKIKYYNKNHQNNQNSSSHKNIKSNFSFIDSIYQPFFKRTSKSVKIGPILHTSRTSSSRLKSNKNQTSNSHLPETLSEIDSSMLELVEKVKALNIKVQKNKNNSQNNLQYTQSQKLNKQTLIINKLTQLGNDISSLLNYRQGKIINHIIRKNHDQSSPIPKMSHNKSTKHFNRTFCTQNNNLY